VTTSPDKPALFHPLCGANIKTLTWLLTTNGPIPASVYSRIAIALGACLMRWPFSTAERLLTYDSRSSNIPAPVFIVGHWRSGTTHLHNVLSQSGDFAYISPLEAGLPWDIRSIVRFLKPLLAKALPEDRYIDNVAVNIDSPQEDSIALANMIPLSYYHGLYFPQRFDFHFNRGVFFDGASVKDIDLWKNYLTHFLGKVSAGHYSKSVLVKNPVYSAHIPRLLELWPDAKFIHIYRNPYDVYPSTKHFYSSLLHQLSLQDYTQVDISRLVLTTYPRLMHIMLHDGAKLPENQFVQVRFETFEQQPMDELERIYTQLDIRDFSAAKPRFKQYLNMNKSYKKNTYTRDPNDARLVEEHWFEFIHHWNYDAQN